MPESHRYVVQAEHIRPCAVCGNSCAPYPEPESPTCSWCWWLSGETHVTTYPDVVLKELRRRSLEDLLS